MGLWPCWLFLDRQYSSLRVELYHAISFRILHRISKDCCTLAMVASMLEHGLESLSIENVIAEDQGHRIVSDEFLADQKGLSKTTRMRLHGICDRDSNLAAISQHTLEIADVLRCGYQENLRESRPTSAWRADNRSSACHKSVTIAY